MGSPTADRLFKLASYAFAAYWVVVLAPTVMLSAMREGALDPLSLLLLLVFLLGPPLAAVFVVKAKRGTWRMVPVARIVWALALLALLGVCMVQFIPAPHANRDLLLYIVPIMAYLCLLVPTVFRRTQIDDRDHR